MGAKMKLSEYLDGIRAARTCEEMEEALKAPHKHHYIGRTWNQICNARIETGNRICDEDPVGHFVPRFGKNRALTVCGEAYKVGRGGNSTGVRYAWHYAGEWAMGILRSKGLSIRASHRIWDSWSDYPHRCLPIIRAALAGQIQDPELGVLHPHNRKGGSPINYSIERNDRDEYDRRAHKPCACGGTLFDWGAGSSEGFEFINWHCNGCPEVFTEYMTREQLYALRRSAKVGAPVGQEGTPA